MKTIFEKDVAAGILLDIEASYTATININGKTHRISALATMGAHDFLYDKNEVIFKIKGAKDFNKIKITLNDKDTYDIELWNVKIYDKEPYLIMEKTDEYNDVHVTELGNLLVREVLY